MNIIDNNKLTDDQIVFSILNNMILLFETHLPKKILKSEEFEIIKYRIEELEKRTLANSFTDCN